MTISAMLSGSLLQGPKHYLNLTLFFSKILSCKNNFSGEEIFVSINKFPSRRERR